MFSVTSIVVVACALVLGVQGQANVCSNVDNGDVPTSHPVELPPVILQPYVADFIVTVPKVPECIIGVSGVHVRSCDVDLPPHMYFASPNTLMFHRTGGLNGVATVTVTVYCKV